MLPFAPLGLSVVTGINIRKIYIWGGATIRRFQSVTITRTKSIPEINHEPLLMQITTLTDKGSLGFGGIHLGPEGEGEVPRSYNSAINLNIIIGAIE